MLKSIKIWLREGKQSRITKLVKDISDKFSGNDFEKIKSILKWTGKNIRYCKDDRKARKIFATRTASEVLKDGFSTGCHDDALIFATLCRAVGIPAKFVGGISKLTPGSRGHCVVEAYIDESWILVDISEAAIYLDPKRSNFYKENFLIGKGLDAWDIGIKSFKTWREKSNKIINIISKMKV